MRRRAGRAAWAWLLGSMFSMLTWRVVLLLNLSPPFYFNHTIAIWGSTCLFISMFLFGREIRRREQAESQRDALLESERAAREQAERANRFKDQFLGALSHELRTPLTAILGWVGMMRVSGVRQPSQAEWEEAMRTIERNARAQARLIDDLLDVTRITVGTLRLERARVRLAAPVTAAVETVRPLAEQKGVQVYHELDETLEASADPFRIQQIAWNLLTNAIKFTPAGGEVRITLARDKTRDGSSFETPTALLTVRDTGQGIETDFIPHLFSRFRQADGAVSRRHGGLGMGLSIVKSLVELHGGTIAGVSDGADRGSTFTVRLPLMEPESNAESSQPKSVPQPSTVRPQVLSNVTVVVVDDEPDIRTMLQRVLEHHGARVYVGTSAEEAGELVRTIRPNVLVSDIGMPGTDGYTFIRRLRQNGHPRGTGLRAVAVTAYTREVDRRLAIDSGFDAHVAKPIDPAVLISTIANLAQQHPGPSAGATAATSFTTPDSGPSA